jgi:hypothetical protein
MDSKCMPKYKNGVLIEIAVFYSNRKQLFQNETVKNKGKEPEKSFALF